MSCRTDLASLLALGAGPMVIGQAAEFDSEILAAKMLRRSKGQSRRPRRTGNRTGFASPLECQVKARSRRGNCPHDSWVFPAASDGRAIARALVRRALQRGGDGPRNLLPDASAIAPAPSAVGNGTASRLRSSAPQGQWRISTTERGARLTSVLRPDPDAFGSFHSGRWCRRQSQLKIAQEHLVEDTLASAIGDADQLVHPIIVFCLRSRTCFRGIGLFHESIEFSFNGSAIRYGSLAQCARRDFVGRVESETVASLEARSFLPDMTGCPLRHTAIPRLPCNLNTRV